MIHTLLATASELEERSCLRGSESNRFCREYNVHPAVQSVVLSSPPCPSPPTTPATNNMGPTTPSTTITITGTSIANNLTLYTIPPFPTCLS